jgi:hypothetical protein
MKSVLMGRYIVIIILTVSTILQLTSCHAQNSTPVIVSEPKDVAYIGYEFFYQVVVTDEDGDPITYSLLAGPRGSQIHGTNGDFRWTPREDQIGENSITIQVSDGKCNVTQEFIVDVFPINNPPEFTTTPVTQAFVGAEYSYGANATDQDGDKLKFTLREKPEAMVVDRDSGELSWIPTENDVGTQKIILRVADKYDFFDEQTFEVTVSFIRPIIFITSPVNNTTVSGKISLRGVANISAGQITAVTVRIDDGVWKQATGKTNWYTSIDTTTLENGRHTVRAKATTGYVESDEIEIILNVENEDPTLTNFILAIAVIVILMIISTVSGIFILSRRHRKAIKKEIPDDDKVEEDLKKLEQELSSLEAEMDKEAPDIDEKLME